MFQGDRGSVGLPGAPGKGGAPGKMGLPGVVSNMSTSVSSDFQAPRGGVKKTRYSQVQAIWKPDVALFHVFDIASQTSSKFWRNSKRNFTRFFDNKMTIPNRLHGSDFPVSFSLHELLMSLKSSTDTSLFNCN